MTAATVEIHGTVAPGFEPVREAFAANFERGEEAGASFAATVEGEFVVDIWAGTRDIAGTLPWERDTIVNVFSTTKATVATACAMLVDRGLLDYGEKVRCALSINHDHPFGRRHQACDFRVAGTEGAAYLQLGVNLNYPEGEADILEIYPKGGDGWVAVPLDGKWFPDAFTGRMANLQRHANGEDAELISSVEDAWNTMALVEAAYASSASPATPLERKP